MSVWLHVGDFSSSAEEHFAQLNMTLEAAALPPHREPAEARGGVPWMLEIGGYGCFYHLRRVAACVALGHGLPRPTMDFEEVWSDPVLRQYYRKYRLKKPRPKSAATGTPAADEDPGSSIRRSGAPFAHLMQHQYAAAFGYYLPVEFAEVIVALEPLTEWPDPVGVGSCYALHRECATLAKHLQFPPDIPIEELDQLRRREEDPTARTGWERFALECFVCKALLTGAEISLRSGCALTFG